MSLEDENASRGQVDPETDSVPVRPDLQQVAAPASLVGDTLNVIRGFCMGAANIVPGVSGGTIALIMGHYERLIAAVSRIDRHLVALALSKKWGEAWTYVDGRFLTGIGAGVVVGSVALAGLMNWLLEEHLPETFAIFFGMILGSVVIVRRYVTAWTPACLIACVAGIAGAVVIGRLSPTDGGDSLLYLFICAAIAICAMILPGISGAFILLLLGVYHSITGMIKDLAKGDFDAASLMQIGVFCFGCLFGLLAFSRLLHWLLDHHKSLTMSALVGMMLGSIDKLWPLQIPSAETAGLRFKERVMEHVHPRDWEGSVWLLVALAIVSAVFVLLLEQVSARAVASDHESAD